MLTVMLNRSPSIDPFYADLTAASGPFWICGIWYGPNGSIVAMEVEVDSQPASFTSDWTTRHQLTAPLRFG